MKKNKNNPVLITLKGENYKHTARVPLWKAYLILSEIEREKAIKENLSEVFKKK